MSVGFSIQDIAMDVARYAPREAHYYHADVDLLRVTSQGIKRGLARGQESARHRPRFYVLSSAYVMGVNLKPAARRRGAPSG